MIASQEQGFALGNKKWGKPQLRQCEFWFIQCMVYLIPANRSLEQGFTPDHLLVPQFLHQEICTVLCSSSCFFAVVGCQKGLFLLLHRCSLQPGLLFTPFHKASASMSLATYRIVLIPVCFINIAIKWTVKGIYSREGQQGTWKDRGHGYLTGSYTAITAETELCDGRKPWWLFVPT